MDPPATGRRISAVHIVNMSQQARNYANLTIAIEHVIVPRAGRLPTNSAALLSNAVLSFCPAVNVAKLNRADYLACLISETLVEAGR